MAASETLIAGDAIKAAALQYSAEMKARVRAEQGGLLSVFDGWFTRVIARLLQFDPSRFWEDSVREFVAQNPREQDLQWDILRLRLFLDRRQRGRYVSYTERKEAAAFYHPRFGTEFGPDVLLTCQGAPSLMRWRGIPLMKNVFDFAMYPALLAELRPLTVFEIGSGMGASAIWFADNLAFYGVEARVHSVDRAKPAVEHPGVDFRQGDCSDPQHLFDPESLRRAPHPWLVVEDAHHNVGEVLEYFHKYLSAGDYLVVEDSDVKHDTLRHFTGLHPGAYLVDTRFTDNFGRNATCAADSIFIRTQTAA